MDIIVYFPSLNKHYFMGRYDFENVPSDDECHQLVKIALYGNRLQSPFGIAARSLEHRFIAIRSDEPIYNVMMSVEAWPNGLNSTLTGFSDAIRTETGNSIRLILDGFFNTTKSEIRRIALSRQVAIRDFATIDSLNRGQVIIDRLKEIKRMGDSVSFARRCKLVGLPYSQAYQFVKGPYRLAKVLSDE